MPKRLNLFEKKLIQIDSSSLMRTLALAEAYGSVGNDRIAPVLKKAVELILTTT